MILTPDQRVRVFVSSTLQELAEERAAARRAIENLRLTPVLFELGARPHPPRDVYQRYLEQSDVFVGIYGESYGWVSPDMEISGLDDEYALGSRLPRLLYVKHPAPGRDPRLSALIERIEEEADVSYRTFADAAELRRLVEDDLALLLSERFGRREAKPLRTSLPAPVDRFVGRDAELDVLERLLTGADGRLVTVTGPGGVGKTRLALEAARRASPRFAEGAHLVPLGPIADPDLVAATISQSLGAVQGAVEPLAAVIEALRDVELLVVLDNFEHVLAAAPDVEELLRACPRVAVLVTSRTVLKLRGERELRIDPLAEAEAVGLFVDRAKAANQSFELTEEHRGPVAELCGRLEGIPLAVELAAAQVRILPPSAILDRLAGPLDLRAAGGPTYPDRQRTLEATIDWSFGLLDEEERAVCLRAGVFRGGFTLEALEAVAMDSEGRDVLEVLATLVESSLVRPDRGDGEPRYSMLETVAAYARRQLEARGDVDSARNRHALFFGQLLTEAGSRLRCAQHETTLAALDRENDNIRSALDWMLERGELERVVDAGWALLPYWTLRERLAEARRWLAEARGRRELSDLTRAKSLIAEGILALWSSDFLTAAPLLIEGAGLARAAEAEEAVAVADVGIGTLEVMRGATHGVSIIEAARGVFTQLGDEWGEAMATVSLAWGSTPRRPRLLSSSTRGRSPMRVASGSQPRRSRSARSAAGSPCEARRAKRNEPSPRRSNGRSSSAPSSAPASTSICSPTSLPLKAGNLWQPASPPRPRRASSRWARFFPP